MEIKSNIRPIILGKVGDKFAHFLLDTGANIPLIDFNQIFDYNLEKGEVFPGTILGTGGIVKLTYFCKNNVMINNSSISGFVFTDLNLIKNSIKRETGIEILGIISYPQMRSLKITLDLANNEIYGI